MEDQFLTPLDNNEPTNLSIRDLFFKYLRFLPLFIISVALSLFVAYIYLRYATPIYSATGSMIIKEDQVLKGNDKYDQFLASDHSKDIQNEIEVLKSRPLMERVVKSLNLNFNYYAIGKIKELNIYKGCPFYIDVFSVTDSSNGFQFLINFRDQNHFSINGENKEFGFGQILRNPFGVFRLVRRNEFQLGDKYRVTWSPTFPVASALSSSLVVAPKSSGTGILLLTLETDNAQYTSDVINEVMDQYQTVTLEDKNATNQRSKAFIDDRLKVVSHELDSINHIRLLYMQSNNIFDPEAQSATFLGSITDADKNINLQNTQAEIVTMIENYLTDKKNAYDPVPSSLGIQDQTLGTMIGGYNVAQLEHKALLDENIPKGNALVKQKEEQIEKLRQNILENLRNVKSSINTSVESLKRQSSKAESQVRTLPAKQQVLEDIKRQQASKLSVYNYLMEKREEAAIALASNITSSKILDEAYPNATPIKPKKRNIQLMASLVGILLPALFIFILEIMDDKVTTRMDINRLTPVPVLGEVGHSYGTSTLMVTPNNRGVIAEQFRILRSNIQYLLANTTKPVILVTSSFSGEGKSFVSTNMGAVMALAGKKTIILEFDIRKPKILSQLHIPKKVGLTNFLLGKVKAEDLPVPVEGSANLFVLPCGPVPPNPAELLLDPKVKDLFTWLRQNFDVVVMDTAPIGMVSDAMTLAEFADTTLYIVRQGHTFKKQIGMIDEFQKSGKLPKISIVLNDVKIRTGYGYYGYGRYGYGKGYGYGAGYYDEEIPPPTRIERILGWMDFSKWTNNKSKKTEV
ncbi:MAG: GumC family protein [Flavisolibacter sp.]